ncbi:uncharacterized protein LOC135296202 [Passer domesticus]|uniref:uncharacterized protein LOC135296202 n=1 Tax=Passer domesticus TaxID=48849 RepID=UPI0030FE4CDD
MAKEGAAPPPAPAATPPPRRARGRRLTQRGGAASPRPGATESPDGPGREGPHWVSWSSLPAPLSEGNHNLSRQSALLDHLGSKEVARIQVNLPSLCTVSCPITGHQGEEAAPSSRHPSFRPVLLPLCSSAPNLRWQLEFCGVCQGDLSRPCHRRHRARGHIATHAATVGAQTWGNVGRSLLCLLKQTGKYVGAPTSLKGKKGQKTSTTAADSTQTLRGAER